MEEIKLVLVFLLFSLMMTIFTFILIGLSLDEIRQKVHHINQQIENLEKSTSCEVHHE